MRRRGVAAQEGAGGFGEGLGVVFLWEEAGARELHQLGAGRELREQRAGLGDGEEAIMRAPQEQARRVELRCWRRRGVGCRFMNMRRGE